MEVTNNEGKNKNVKMAFFVTAGVIVVFHLIRTYAGLEQLEFIKLWLIGMLGVFGLLIINFTGFTMSLVTALISSKKICKESVSEEEKEEKFEEIMVPALQGRRVPPKATLKIFGFLISICLGLIVGSISAWVIVKIIAFTCTVF